MTQKKTLRRLFASALLSAGLVATCTNVHAQALYTAEKGADIFVFGGYNHTVPDYGPDGFNNTGFTLGVDYTRYFGWYLGGLPIDPSLEIRGTYAKGQVVEERTGMAGFRVHTAVKNRYHPYVDVLFGLGVIDYAAGTGFPRDHGLAYSLGGGIDVDIVHNFQLKLDYQLQSWNLGPNAVQVPQGGDYTLSPQALTIGVSYQIPFKSNVGPNSHSTKPPKEEKPHPTTQPAPSAAPTPAPTADTTTAPAPADTAAPAATPTPADTTTPPPTPAPADSASGTATPPPANL